MQTFKQHKRFDSSDFFFLTVGRWKEISILCSGKANTVCVSCNWKLIAQAERMHATLHTEHTNTETESVSLLEKLRGPAWHRSHKARSLAGASAFELLEYHRFLRVRDHKFNASIVKQFENDAG